MDKKNYPVSPLGEDIKCECVNFYDILRKLIYKCDTNPLPNRKSYLTFLNGT